MFGFVLAANLMAAGNSEERLFRFERSKNANYICYDAHLQDGHLDRKDPLSVYWIRMTQGGIRKELSLIQRKLAFGYKVIKSEGDEVCVHLSAYNRLPIRICQRDGKWVALVTLDGREALLTKMYAKTVTPESLKVEYVDIFGTDCATGQKVTKRITQ